MSAPATRQQLEYAAAAAIELKRRKQARKTVYGFYEPTGEYGGRLVKCLQEQGGEWVEVDAEPDVTLAAKMEPILTKDKRFKLLIGGRGSSKSMGIGDIAASRAKDYGDKTLCMREVQNTLEDSVHALLKNLIEGHGWFNFDITDKHIQLGGQDVFKFRGIARNPDGVKSMFGFKFGWVEEAQGLSAKSIEVLTPTLREAGSELLFTLNPQSSGDPIAERFLMPYWSDIINHGYYEDDLHLIVQINYTDNPWHRELEAERASDESRLSRTAYEHKWLGMFNDDIDNALISAEWFDACIDAHEKLGFKPLGAKVAAYDPSDEGKDAKGYCLRHGSVVTDVQTVSQGDVNEGTDWAIDRAIAAGADWFSWDGDGLGLSLKRQVSESLAGKHIDYRIFRGSESPEHPKAPFVDVTNDQGEAQQSNEQALTNRRAQFYVRLRDRVYNTYRAVVHGEYKDPDELISFSSEIDCMRQLRAEMCRIPLKPNGSGRIQLLSKVEMARKPYELASPNLADSVMMSMMVPPVKQAAKSIRFQGWG